MTRPSFGSLLCVFAIFPGFGCRATASFRMPIRDVFSIQGRGTIVTGSIESGRVGVGDTLWLVAGEDTLNVMVVSIERFRATGLRSASAGGDEVGLGLDGVLAKQIPRGALLLDRQ